MPFSGSNSGMEIVPRWPGANPCIVAAVSLTTETTTSTLAWLSTSKRKVIRDGIGSVVGVVPGVDASVDESADRDGALDGLGVGLQAQSAIRSAAKTATTVVDRDRRRVNGIPTPFGRSRS
jgi:hypothetical protein